MDSLIDESAQMWRGRLLSLLGAVVDACDDSKIKAFLYGRTALLAYRDGILCDYPEICIDIRDADRFAAAMRSFGRKSGIILDSPDETAFFPRFEYRVIDCNTIDFNVRTAYRYRCNGLGIGVLLMAHEPDGQSLVQSREKLEAAHGEWVASYYETGERRLPEQLADAIDCQPDALPERAAKAAFECYKSLCSFESKRVVLRKKAYPSDIFSTVSRVEIEGRSLPLPGKAEKYLTRHYGKSWKTRKVASFTETGWRFRDAGHSWAEYEPKVAHIDFREVAHNLDRQKELNESYQEENLRLLPYKDYLIRTHYHYLLLNEYAGRSGHLEHLLQMGELGQLELELESYLGKMEECRDAGLGLCFDDEMFRIALEYLRSVGREEYADEVESLVRAEMNQTEKLGAGVVFS